MSIEEKYLMNESTFGYEDEINDSVKGLHKWLIDFEKAYDNDNKRLARAILGNIRQQVDKMIRSM